MFRISTAILCIVLCINSLFSQEDKDLILKGKVVDSDTYEAIPYANIYIKNTSLGTMSDTLGHFELAFQEKFKFDSVFVSSIGYTTYQDLINDLDLKKEIVVELNDTFFLLSEATALAYDNFEGLYWNSKKGPGTKLLMTCATRQLLNVANFIKILKSEYGEQRSSANVMVWKKIKIKELKNKKLKITLTYRKCQYCPGARDLNMTLGVRKCVWMNLRLAGLRH